MFTFGTFDAHEAPGLAAVLVSWPGMPDVAMHTVASPGRDGVFFAEAGITSGAFTFDLVAMAAEPADVLAIASEVAGALNPRDGQQLLTVDIAPGWVWNAVLESRIDWARSGWEPGHECRLLASVEFNTPDPYGYAAPDETWIWSTPGAREISRTMGNVDSLPAFEIRAVLSAGQHVTVAVDGASVRVDGPLTAAQAMRLDYRTMGFGIWNAAGTTKLASLVDRMSTFERLTLPKAGEPATVTTSTNGTLEQIRFEAQSRRL